MTSTSKSTLNDYFKNVRNGGAGLSAKGGKAIIDNEIKPETIVAEDDAEEETVDVILNEPTTSKKLVAKPMPRKTRVTQRKKVAEDQPSIAALLIKSAETKVTPEVNIAPNGAEENVVDVVLSESTTDTKESATVTKESETVTKLVVKPAARKTRVAQRRKPVKDQPSIVDLLKKAATVKKRSGAIEEEKQSSAQKRSIEECDDKNEAAGSGAVNEMEGETQQAKKLKTAEEPLEAVSSQPSETVEANTPRTTRSSVVESTSVSTPEKLKLQKCSNLTQLRAQLLKVKNCGAKLDDFHAGIRDAQFEAEAAAALVAKARGNLPSPRKTYKSPCKPSTPTKLSFASPRKALHPLLKDFTSVDIEVPVTPTKTPTKDSPLKSPLPAHRRFQHLLHADSSADQTTTLPMPLRYRVLREMFRACDTVVSLLHNRNETITFTKLQPAVQKMLKRAFIQRHLGQLKTVYPLAYVFRQDKVRQTGPDGLPRMAYDLTITPRLDTSSVKVDLSQRLDGLRTADGSRKLDSSALVKRREVFHASLLESLHRHHAEYLKTVLSADAVPKPSTIFRWHTGFMIEDVPDVDSADLPLPPGCQTYNTAASALSVARNLFAVNPRMAAAIERVANKSNADAASSCSSVTSTPSKSSLLPTPQSTPQSSRAATAPASTPKPVNSALKGVSASLLAKIRAKEAAASQRDMTRSAHDIAAHSVLTALPEVARILRQTAVGERKWALAWPRAVTVLRESHSGAGSQTAAETLLEAALKQAPELLTKHVLSAGLFLKVNKTADVNSVCEKLVRLAKAAA